jgi:hypothetical protein
MSMTRRLLVSVLLVASVFAQIPTATAQTFPQLGGYLIGGNTTPLTPAHVAPLDVMILGAYVGWTSNAGLNPAQFAAAARAINPNFKMFVYTLIESSPTNPPQPTNVNMIANVPWWLYQAGTSGTMVSGCCGSLPYPMNITTYSKVYNGQNYPTWRAQRDVGQFLTPFPAVNGLYVDNVYSVPRISGDWTLSGSSQSNSDSTTQHIYRLGYVSYFNTVRATASSSQQLIVGNVADWYTNGFGMSNVTDYQGILNGGVMEGIQGQEAVSWARLMTDYASIMKNFAAPYLGIFSVDGNPTDYQNFRYFYASCLLDNGYFFYDNNGSYNDYVTFDEYSFGLGGPTAGPNNPSNGTYSSGGIAVYQNGVYRRDFANGIALVNPKGNGTQTVTLETSYKHLSGTQDSTTNNGQTVTTVTLNDRDGVILQRLTSQAIPDAPSLTVQ